MLEDFVKLFETKDYEERMLAVMNRDIRLKREEQEQLAKQKELMLQLAKQNQQSKNQIRVKSLTLKNSVLDKTNATFIYESQKEQQTENNNPT